MTDLSFDGRTNAVQQLTWRSTALTAVAAGVLGWAGAMGGKKGMGALAVAAVLAVVLVLSDRRREVAVVGTVLSSAAIVHKTFSPLAAVSSGPPSIYVSSVDMMVGLLYILWVLEGTLLEDVRRAWRIPMVRAPLVGAALMGVSVVVSPDLGLTIALLIRMTVLYALFLYVAARTRTRSDVWVILGTFGGLALFEGLVVAGQWVTKGTLGMSFLGTPPQLGERITDTATLGRPFGTIIHPVFMGAFVGILGLLALSVAIHIQDRRVKAAAIVASAAATLPMVISHTRSAMLAVVVAGLAMVIVAWYRGRLTGRTLAYWLSAAAVAVVLLWPQISALWNDNLAGDHFSLEVDSRVELNAVAIDMIKASPLVGHGPNGFEQVMGDFDDGGLIFADNPVHNLFLLQLAETGVVGFVGLLVVGGSFALGSFRLLRAQDPLLAAVGSGFGAILVFFLVEEQFVFSLRQDHPATLFWIAAGLVAACGAQAGTEPYRLRQADLLAHGDLPLRAPAPPLGTRLRGALNGVARLVVHGVAPVRSAAGRTVTSAAAVLARRRERPAPRYARGRTSSDAGWAGLLLGRQRWGMALRILVALALVPPVLLGSTASTAPVALGGTEIVMTLRDRATGGQSIWKMDGDGTGLQRLTPDDGMTYAWSEWAFNGTKIVFSARRGPAGSPEGIFLMNPDGTGRQQIADNPWQNGQPRVSPDGTKLLFTSAWAEYEKFALYSMDLATGMVRNLSATTSQAGAVDSDAKWVTDDQIVFATSFDETGAVIPTQLAVMRADGSGRQRITADRFYNTDPEVSPDGRTVTWAAYRGEGDAGTDGDDDDQFKVKLEDWYLLTQDLETGVQRTLNEGGPCAARPVVQPCGPLEGPAYIPNWVPGGSSIAFLSILSRTRVCICVVQADGTGAEVAFASDENEIQWFDIVVPGSPPAAGPDRFGTEAPQSRLLLGGTDRSGGPLLVAAEPDRFGELALARLATILLEPFSARWSPDRRQITFSAVLPNEPEPTGYGPRPPAGQRRQRHFTLDFVNQFFFPPIDRADAARRQVFVMDAGGTGVRQVTWATTEDYRDAIPDGEVRGNVEPSFSPDGRYLVVTNISEVSRESFLLRIDLRTGAVLNLTNGTAGAMPTADFNPEWSPDGGHVAFSTVIGASTQIAVVDRDGLGFRQITDDDYVNLSPAWSPDGSQLVYASYRGSEPMVVTSDLLAGGDSHLNMEGWALVKVDVRTGAQTVLTTPDVSPTLNPVWSPEGDQIAFISVSGPPLQPDVWVIGADGSDPRPLQVTLLSKETSVDWR